MGVQEISGRDWHNSSINSHVYWIARLLLSFTVSLLPGPLSVAFSALSLAPPVPLSAPPSVSFNVFVYRPIRGASATALTFLARVASLPFSSVRSFTSVVNPELVTSSDTRNSQAAVFNEAAARGPLIGVRPAARAVCSCDERVKNVRL